MGKRKVQLTALERAAAAAQEQAAAGPATAKAAAMCDCRDCRRNKGVGPVVKQRLVVFEERHGKVKGRRR